MTKIDGLLSEAEAASALGLKFTTLRNYAVLRKGPPRIRIGKKIFYRYDALVAWIESRERDYGAVRASRRA
jgi:hypothetical protein